MPLYDYRCEDCGHDFEAQRPIDRRDEAECPRCGSTRTRRLVRGVGFLTRGGAAGASAPRCAPRSGFG